MAKYIIGIDGVGDNAGVVGVVKTGVVIGGVVGD